MRRARARRRDVVRQNRGRAGRDCWGEGEGSRSGAFKAVLERGYSGKVWGDLERGRRVARCAWGANSLPKDPRET